MEPGENIPIPVSLGDASAEDVIAHYQTEGVCLPVDGDGRLWYR